MSDSPPKLIVQKFGGTSIGTLELIQSAASRIAATRRTNAAVIAVVSAMADDTDRLMEQAAHLQQQPSPRELDVLLASGEQRSMALLCMALHNAGCAARSATGAQAGIATDGRHSRARIRSIRREPLQAILDSGAVAVVAGFQGSDAKGNITTLGRGGSDTTAVALAAAMGADECQIYTDVKGVYTTDPRICEGARLLPHITFEEMLELAGQGSRVLQIRAVEFAGKYGVPLRVLSAFEDGPGTRIVVDRASEHYPIHSQGGKSMEQPVVSGIACNRDEAKVTIVGVPDEPGVASRVLSAVARESIGVDVILQNVGHDGITDFSFTVHRGDLERATAVVRPLFPDCSVETNDKVGKIALVGVGMRSHAGVAATMFEALAEEGINIQMITTSEIKITVIIEERYLELATRAVHSAFGMEQPQGQPADAEEQEQERTKSA